MTSICVAILCSSWASVYSERHMYHVLQCSRKRVRQLKKT